jgi:hypothetical protein
MYLLLKRVEFNIKPKIISKVLQKSRISVLTLFNSNKQIDSMLLNKKTADIEYYQE